MSALFDRIARATARAVGSPWAFLLAVLVTILWAVVGPFFGYSDTWQLVINTGTTIATFLIVFLIQHTQNRDSQATQLKLDELIRAMTTARTELVNLEMLPEAELDKLQKDFAIVRDQAAQGVEQVSEARMRDSTVSEELNQAGDPPLAP